jgi:hypothetical protein
LPNSHTSALIIAADLLPADNDVRGAVDGAVSRLDAASAVAVDAQSHPNLEVKGLR